MAKRPVGLLAGHGRHELAIVYDEHTQPTKAAWIIREPRAPLTPGVERVHDAHPEVDGSEAMSDEIGAWREWLIKSEATDEVAFSSVLAHSTSGELLITQYDRQAMVLRRYEWQPSGAADARLSVFDWDDQQLFSRLVPEIPDPPSDRAGLSRLLDELDR